MLFHGKKYLNILIAYKYIIQILLFHWNTISDNYSLFQWYNEYKDKIIIKLKYFMIILHDNIEYNEFKKERFGFFDWNVIIEIIITNR